MIDASAVLAYLLAPDDALGSAAIIVHPHHELHAPALCDVEVLSALRRLHA